MILTNNASIFGIASNHSLCYDPYHHYTLNWNTETHYGHYLHWIGQNCLYADTEILDHGDDDVANDENNANYESVADFGFDQKNQSDVENDSSNVDLVQMLRLHLRCDEYRVCSSFRGSLHET